MSESRLSLLERKSVLTDEILSLSNQIDNSYWDDAFVDEPEYHSSHRRDLVSQKEKKVEELNRINALLK